MCALQVPQLWEYGGKPSRSEFDALDGEPDRGLDELTELAARLCDADFAYVGWMNSGFLRFKSHFGFKAAEQQRSLTGCHWMLETGTTLTIADAARDKRFAPEGIALPGGEICRSYAGTPLLSNSHQTLGTLAVLSRAPGEFNGEESAKLETLARQVVARLELNSSIKALELAQRARERTERALAIERAFVAATLDSIPALVAVLDTAGRMVRLNDPCEQLTGLSDASAVGRAFIEEVLEEEDREWAAAKLRDAAAGQVCGPHETAWRVAGGPPRRIVWSLRPLKGPGGEIQYLIVSGQDVTEQRQAEMALLSSEARYREVVENSLGFVFTCSTEGRLTSLNAFTAETLGYRAADLAGRPVAELLDASGSSTFHDCLRALETQEEWQGALQLRRSDGVYRRIALRSRRMQLPGERPFVLNHGMDVTEQHAAEEALHRATRQRELILESAGDGICGIDLEGRLTFVNQAAARTLGYAPEELAGQDVREATRHSGADGVPYSKEDSPILKAMHRREAIRMRDEMFWRRDGVAIPVEYSASPLIEDGEISGMVVGFQDISERRRLERMKDEFISTVSHELRTPLTSLRASLGLISSGSLEKRPEKRHQMVGMAIENCDRLVRLVNDILDFDSVERGKLPLHRKQVEAIDLLRRAADVAHAAATQVHIGFRIEAPPVAVVADEDRILQVLNELVTNAIKFSPPETLIRLTAVASAEAEVRFSVEDQGRGIAPEKLERIFDRFQQGDASDSRSRGGTGLGLALCRSIVEQHGGRLWAESTPGKGSRFLFTLPRAEAGPPLT